MKLARIAAPDFDLEKTLNSGQVFHWEKTDRGFVGAIGEQPVRLQQRGQTLIVRHGTSELIRNYFALDHPLAEICASFPDDEAMRRAREFCHGLRIIRQPKWECLATFICSSMKQVAHIRQISRKLRERFGTRQTIDHLLVHTFPSAERIARSSEGELRKCGVGYRAINLFATARAAANGEVDLTRMSGLSDVDLHAALCELPGVGAKVANCVMLFAYERLRAFPIDVWIERVLREQYFANTRRVTAQRLRQFTQSYFGEHGGYAQQYLYHYGRLTRHLSARKR
jgi:N-glycosylase/DNA lyase